MTAAGAVYAPQAAAATPLAGPGCDFNDNGRDDLAIGVPGEGVGSISKAGMVHVFFGNSPRLSAAGSTAWHQNVPTVEGVAQAGDAFGAAVACGDFDGDGNDDMVVGIPRERVGFDFPNAGIVQVFYGSLFGPTAVRDRIFSQSTLDVQDSAESGDEFGSALAVGDFNGDGRADLAIGVPGENIDGSRQAGAVNILYGGEDGLSAAGNDFFHQNSPGVLGGVGGSEAFGSALAAGDFDGDGRDDLAIGVPGEKIANASFAGTVHVLYGAAGGITTAGDQVLSQATPGVAGTTGEGDAFGTALAAGDFDGDGRDDLAVGVPGDDHSGGRNVGSVNVLYGSSGGLTGTDDPLWSQATDLIEGAPEDGDAYGSALVAADFDGDGRDDLAIGVPGESVGDRLSAGAVNILYGTGSGLATSGDEIFSQATSGVKGLAEEGDRFGTALSAGDYNGDGRADLAIGGSGESVDGVRSAGAVNVLYGTRSGMSVSGDQIWHQNASNVTGFAEPYDQLGGAPLSNGVYRIAYADGTDVRVSRHHLDHTPILTRYDLVGEPDGTSHVIVAARDGFIRAIVDTNAEPTDDNNYVYIEHEDGEFTKYSHFRTDSVTGSGRFVGEFVRAGTRLGIEDRVGTAGSVHLHWEVSVPDDPADAFDSEGFPRGHNRVPQICNIPGNMFIDNHTYTAGPCAVRVP